MRFHIIAVGQKMPAWVETGFTDYAKRFSSEFSLTLTEVPAEKRTQNKNTESIKQGEGTKILHHLTPGSVSVALDEHGKLFTTTELATQIEAWRLKTSMVQFFIGGADGLSKECLEKANIKWSLSPLTFPHALVRIMLAEQLYRAVSILKGHPYHRV